MRSCSGKVKRLKKGRKAFELLSKNMRVVIVLAFLAQAFVAGAQTNIAPTGSASASSQQSGYPAANAIDNNTGTRWSANTTGLNEWLKVDLGAVYSFSRSEVMWEVSGVYKYKVEVSSNNSSWTQVVNQTGNTNSKQTFTDYFSASARYVRITATGLPSGRRASICEFRTFTAPVNIALGNTTLTSSTQLPNNIASNAVDGNTGTRWAASSSALNEWLMVDLGSTSTLSGTEVMWEKTGVYKYKVEVSNDNASWTQVVNQTGNSASKQTFTDYFTQKTGRYVKITATGLPSGYWASIYEFRIFSPFPDPAKWYRLVFLHSNMILYNLYKTSTIVQSVFDYNIIPSQLWQLLPASTPGYYLMQLSTKSVLDNTNGTISAKASTGGANQQFKLLPSSKSGYYYVVDKQLGKAVEVVNSSLSNGARVGDNSINTNPPVSTQNLGCANQLVKLEDATPWSQTEFMIGAYIGPYFTTDSLNKFKSANFNTISYGLWDTYFTTSTLTPGLTTTSLPPINVNDYNYLVTNFTRTNEYCFSKLKEVGGLKMLMMDGAMMNHLTTDPFSIAWDFWAMPPEAQCQSDVNYVAVAYKNYSKFRNQMLGYFIAGEPDGNNQITRANLIKNDLSAADPGMLGFNILKAYWGFSSWNDYIAYVDYYISDPNTRAACYSGYWVFEDGNSPSGYDPMNNPNGEPCSYFLHLNLFASTIQYYNNLGGKQTTFLGCFGSSCEESGGGAHHPIPTDLTLRYYASTNLIYGSKGMNWYTYLSDPVSRHFAIENTQNDATHPIYSLIQKINGELKTMGPVLLGLDWIKTVHGASTDPCSGEFDLLTGDMSDNIIAMVGEMVPYPGPTAPADQMLDYMAVGEFQPHAGDQSVKYVLIMNKWLQYQGNDLYSGKSTDFYYTAIGTNKKIYQFNKSTGAWKQLSTSVYRGTTFDLVVAPGDVQLIKITN